ncbi:hypothetical protein Tco_1467925 [Tanacetum coccineum]
MVLNGGSMVSCSGAVEGDEGSDVGSVTGVGGMVVDSVGAGTDKSKITRKQSKESKHGHENQKSSKRSQRSKALDNFHLQGPILQIPKVIYNLKREKKEKG